MPLGRRRVIFVAPRSTTLTCRLIRSLDEDLARVAADVSVRVRLVRVGGRRTVVAAVGKAVVRAGAFAATRDRNRDRAAIAMRVAKVAFLRPLRGPAGQFQVVPLTVDPSESMKQASSTIVDANGSAGDAIEHKYANMFL